MAPLLELEDVRTAYGSIEALKGISLTVEEGEVVTLIGSNGAGKSTTLRSISGLTPPREGSIRLAGDEVERRVDHVEGPEGGSAACNSQLRQAQVVLHSYTAVRHHERIA